MEKVPKAVKGTLIPVIDKYALLKLRAPQVLMPEDNTSATNVIIAIDISGSMAGSGIANAKDALIQLVNAISKYNLIITVIAFNHTINTISCSSETYTEAINFIKGLHAGGGTVFRNVFQELINITQKNPEMNYFIAFFTDGQDNESYETLNPVLTNFKNTVLSRKISAAIHTLGFGSSHDAVLLSKIIGFETKEGTFQYVSAATGIGEAVAKLTSLIDFSSFWCELIISQTEILRVNFQKDHGIHIATTLMEIVDPNQVYPVTYVLRVHSKETLMLPVEVIKATASSDIIDMAENFTELVRKKLIEIISRMAQEKLSNAELQGQKAIVDIFRDKLSELTVMTLKSKDRRKMAAVEKLKECKEMFTEYFVAFNEAMTNGVISSVSLAKLNNVAYKGVIDSKVAREMAKRTAVGQKYMEEMEENIKSILKGIDFPKLKEEYKDKVEDFGHCAITYETWLDALEEGDCLCLTYDAERNLEEILDSSTVRIKSLNVSMLTAEAFVSAATFVARSQEGIKLTDFGPSKGSQSLAKVLPNEIVNGILPLFICKEHWAIAKLKMAPMNAWTDTHDILAVSKHQPIRIPFLVLIKALDDSKTEHKRKQFQWILDTCIALYHEPENKELIMEDHKETFDKYLEFPQYRTTEFVRSVPIFFSHFSLAIKYKDIKVDDIDALLKAIMEEMLRRNTKDITNDRDEQMDFISALMPMNLRKTAEVLADIAIEKEHVVANTSPAAMFVQMLKSMGIEPDSKYNPPLRENLKGEIEILNKKAREVTKDFEVPMVIEGFDEKVKEVVRKYNDMLKLDPDVNSILHLAREFFGVDPNRYSGLEAMGLKTKEQVAYMVLQNSLQATNAKRKTSVNAGNYLSPFAPVEDVNAALIKLRKAILKDTAEYLVSKRLKGKAKSQKTEEDAKEFAITKNPYEAAGILMGLSTKIELEYFLNEILAGEVPLLKDKLYMVFAWKYEGVVLIENIDGHLKSLSSAFDKLLRKYFLKFSKSDWYEIGARFKGTLNEIYGRAEKNRRYGRPPFP